LHILLTHTASPIRVDLPHAMQNIATEEMLTKIEIDSLDVSILKDV
jgi:hypothetical protein